VHHEIACAVDVLQQQILAFAGAEHVHDEATAHHHLGHAVRLSSAAGHARSAGCEQGKKSQKKSFFFSFCLEIGRFALPHRRAVRCVAAAIALAMSSLVRPQARQRTKAKQQSTFEKKQGCVFVFQLAWRVDLWMARSLA
jgi:hypothetical protein